MLSTRQNTVLKSKLDISHLLQCLPLLTLVCYDTIYSILLVLMIWQPRPLLTVHIALAHLIPSTEAPLLVVWCCLVMKLVGCCFLNLFCRIVVTGPSTYLRCKVGWWHQLLQVYTPAWPASSNYSRAPSWLLHCCGIHCQHLGCGSSHQCIIQCQMGYVIGRSCR